MASMYIPLGIVVFSLLLIGLACLHREEHDDTHF